MYFETFNDFLEMGKHGFYVWLAYGISFAILIGNILNARWRKKQIIKEIARKQRRSAAGVDSQSEPSE